MNLFAGNTGLEATPQTQSRALDWHRIDTVLLDMDGTLLDLHFDNHVWDTVVPKAYAAHLNIPAHRAQLLIQARVNAVTGTIPFYSFAHWHDYTGLDIVALHRLAARLIGFRPGAENFLSTLRKRGKRVIIATNADRQCLGVKDEVLAISNCVDQVISSHDFGIPKEQQAFWQALQDTTSFDPTRTLFVDDTHRVLDAASQFGITETWAVSNPDSKRPPKQQDAYPSLNHFDEICPSR